VDLLPEYTKTGMAESPTTQATKVVQYVTCFVVILTHATMENNAYKSIPMDYGTMKIAPMEVVSR